MAPADYSDRGYAASAGRRVSAGTAAPARHGPPAADDAPPTRSCHQHRV